MKQYLQDKSTYRTHRQFGDVGSTLSICEGREFIARLPGTNAQLKI
jgi:hypothetical protein